MGIRIKRPIIWTTAAYVIGILAGINFKWQISHFYIALSIFVLLAVLAKQKWKGLHVLLLLFFFSLIGIFNTYIHMTPNTDLDHLAERMVTVRGQVLELASQTESKTSFILETHSIIHADSQYTLRSKIRITIYLDPQKNEYIAINPGDWVEVKGELERPQGRRNPKGFDYRAYLARRDVHYVMGEPSRNLISINPGKFKWPISWLQSVRGYMVKAFDTYVGGKESKLVKAMVAGEKWSLPSEVKEQFVNTGIAHILAISGLHVGFVILFVSWLTKRLKLSPIATFIVQGTVLIFYCLLVGASPSVVRATIMAIILLGGRVVGRKVDPLNSMSLAAFIILIFNPLDLLEVGFQLSFGAVAGIILYNEFISRKLRKIPEVIAKPLAVMLAAQLGTWPLIAYHFNIFSPISYIANLVMVPIAGLIVILGLILILMAALFPLLAKVLGWWIWILCGILINGNQWLSSLPWSSLPVVSPGLLFMIIYYIILLIMSEERPSWIRKPMHVSGFLAIVVLLSIVVKPMVDNDLKIVFLDVGQGDCIYIKTPDEKHMLVDGGGRAQVVGDFDTGADIVVPFLLKHGVKKLDLVAMSHVHDDHLGGLIAVMKDLKVDNFLEYPPVEPSEKYNTLKELARGKGVNCIEGKGGQTYRLGNEVFIDIIYPTSDTEIWDRLYQDNENNLSLVMNIRYRDTSILLTGDIGGGVESYLSDIWHQRVTILKVAHHGSKTSSTERWIDNINPKAAVIQVGKNNFGHPDPMVLQRLEEKDVKVFRNDIHGAVTFLYRGGKWYRKTVIRD